DILDGEAAWAARFLLLLVPPARVVRPGGLAAPETGEGPLERDPLRLLGELPPQPRAGGRIRHGVRRAFALAPMLDVLAHLREGLRSLLHLLRIGAQRDHPDSVLVAVLCGIVEGDRSPTLFGAGGHPPPSPRPARASAARGAGHAAHARPAARISVGRARRMGYRPCRRRAARGRSA